MRDIYVPFVQSWLLMFGVTRQEWDDLTQEILIVLVRELPSFQRQRTGSFRAWLRQITVNRTRAFFKSREKRREVGRPGDVESIFVQLEDAASELSRQWDRDHDRHVAQKILELVKNDFAPATWEAFSRFGIDGEPAAIVAEELGLTINAVLLAKSRVLKRLREEAAQMLE